MDRLISEQAVLDTIADFIKNNDSVAKLILNINAIPSAEPYKGMTNGKVITKILKDAEWAELTSDFALVQEDTIHIKVGSYWWNSQYDPQESEDKE